MTPNGFDKLARAYRWMEYLSFGPALQRCRVRFLPRFGDARRCLVLGDGDGRFTARLLQVAPHVRVTAVDASGAMLARLRHTCGAHALRVTTRQAMLPGGLDAAAGGGAFDLVATHFFLDCLSTEEVEQLAHAVRTHLTEDAVWVVSDFGQPRGAFRLPAAVVVAMLYRAFRLLTGLRTGSLPRHDEALEAAGFRRVERTAMLYGLLVAELWTIHANRSA